MIRELQARVGLGWATRATAFLSLALLSFANLALRTRHTGVTRTKPRSLIDPAALRDWPYLLFVAGCFVVFLGLYTPFVYIQSYDHDEHTASPTVALYMLAILNSSSIFGRIMPVFFAQVLGPMNMIIGTSLALGVTALCLITATSFPRLLVAIIVYGFFTGTFFALQPTIFVRLTSNPQTIGTRFGMAFSVMSFALLFGSPISGALRDKLGYEAAWVWAGIAILVGGAIIAAARVCKARQGNTKGLSM